MRGSDRPSKTATNRRRLRGVFRRRIAGASLVLAASLIQPATADTTGGQAAQDRLGRTNVEHLADDIRRSIGRGYEGAISSMLNAAAMPQTPRVASPADTSLETATSALNVAVDALKVEIEAAIGAIGLLPPAAVRAASHIDHLARASLRDRTVIADDTAAATALRDGTRGSRRAKETTKVASLWPEALSLSDFPAPIRAAAKRSPSAARRIAAALDRWVPVLAQAATARGDSSGTQCDLVDQYPIVCVSSQAATLHTSNYALDIDLGGDDVYRGPTASAPFIADGAFFPVAVVIDIAGNDSYISNVRTYFIPGGANDMTHGQATARYGGVGILTDLGGNDVYTSAADDVWQPDGSVIVGGHRYVIAQGGASVGGVALLHDSGGGDRYVVSAADGVDDETVVYGQGYGGSGGVGALVDLGREPDSYELDGGALTHVREAMGFPLRQVVGQGAGYFGGAGVLYDDGGDDVLSAHAKVTRAPQLATYNYHDGLAQVIAQGAAFVGSGLLVTGPGDTSYRVSATGTGLAWSIAIGQGSSWGAGVAILSDAAGDDSYSTVSRMEYAYRESVESAPSEEWMAVDARRDTVTSHASGQGSSMAGTAVLVDHSGNDVYEVSSSHSLDVQFDDQRSNRSQPLRVSVRGFNTSGLWAQGYGVLAGTGVLRDEGTGQDRYSIEARNDLTAGMTTSTGGPPAEIRAETPLNSFVGGQGASLISGSSGVFADSGGEDDIIKAVRASDVRIERANGVALNGSGNMPSFQGAGGNGSFAALGVSPTISAAPSAPTCFGNRGAGIWHGCGEFDDGRSYEDPIFQDGREQYGWGTAPSHNGRSLELSLAGSDPVSVRVTDRFVPVAAVIRDVEGRPVPDATLRFTLQAAWADQLPRQRRLWYEGWQVYGATDATGATSVLLPLHKFLHTDPRVVWRIAVDHAPTDETFALRATRPLLVKP